MWQFVNTVSNITMLTPWPAAMAVALLLGKTAVIHHTSAMSLIFMHAWNVRTIIPSFLSVCVKKQY